MFGVHGIGQHDGTEGKNKADGPQGAETRPMAKKCAILAKKKAGAVPFEMELLHGSAFDHPLNLKPLGAHIRVKPVQLSGLSH